VEIISCIKNTGLENLAYFYTEVQVRKLSGKSGAKFCGGEGRKCYKDE
jgi:hypothetical protein